MPETKKNDTIMMLGKDSLVYIPYRLFPVLFGFLGLWIYTRVFSTAEYGDYSLINITITLLGIFSYSWINESNLRFFTPYKSDGNLKVYFSTSFYMLLEMIFVVTAILIVLAYFQIIPEAITYYLFLIIAQVFVLSFFETLLTLLRADRKAGEVSTCRSVSAFLYLLISLGLIYLFQMGIASILIGYIVTNLAISILIVLRYRYDRYIRAVDFSTRTLRDFVAFGLPLMVTLLFSWVLMLSDRYILEFFRGSTDVGIYSAAYQLADYPITMFASIVMIASYPIIINTWESFGVEATERLITRLVRYYLWFAIPAFVCVTLLARYIMTILPDTYATGAVIIPFICLTKALFCLCFFLNKGLELKKKTLLLALLVGISCVIDVTLNLALVPAWGFLGSGVALGIAYSVYFILSAAISRRYLNWTVSLRSITRIMASTGVMAIVIVAAMQYLSPSIVSLIVLISVGVPVYMIIMVLTGEAKVETRLALRTVSALVKSRAGTSGNRILAGR